MLLVAGTFEQRQQDEARLARAGAGFENPTGGGASSWCDYLDVSLVGGQHWRGAQTSRWQEEERKVLLCVARLRRQPAQKRPR